MSDLISPVPKSQLKNNWKNVIGALLRGIGIDTEKIYSFEATPSATLAPTPIPTPTPTPPPTEYWRNPNMDKWVNYSRNFKVDEIKSALDLASQKHGVPQALLGDVMGLESMAGYYDRPIPPADNPALYRSEMTARGPFMFTGGTAREAGLGLNERYEATPSAIAAAKLISKGQLGRWDVTDMPGAGGNKLTDFYTLQELEKWSRNSKKRRAMLKGLAGK